MVVVPGGNWVGWEGLEPAAVADGWLAPGRTALPLGVITLSSAGGDGGGTTDSSDACVVGVETEAVSAQPVFNSGFLVLPGDLRVRVPELRDSMLGE